MVPAFELEAVEASSSSPKEPQPSMVLDHVSLEDFQQVLETKLQNFFDEVHQEIEMIDCSNEVKKHLQDHHRRITIQLNKLRNEESILTTKDLEKISNIFTPMFESMKMEVNTEMGKMSNLISSFVESKKTEIESVQSTLSNLSIASKNFHQKILERQDQIDSQINAFIIGIDYDDVANTTNCICPAVPKPANLEFTQQNLANFCIFVITIGHVFLFLAKIFRYG